MLRNILIGVAGFFLLLLGISCFGLVKLIFQLSFMNTVGLLLAGLVYGTAVAVCYVYGVRGGHSKLVTIGHVLVLIAIFVGWCWVAPLWAHIYTLHTEMGGWGSPLFYLGVLIGGPLAVGLWLVLALQQPPKVIVAFVVVAVLIVLTGLYQGSRQSGMRDPITREMIVAFCPGSAKVKPGSGELPWKTTHFVSRVAVGKGCHFHPFVRTGAIVKYNEKLDALALLGEYLEQVVGLRLGDSVREMQAKRARAAVQSREWLAEHGLTVTADGDDSADAGTTDGGFTPSMSGLSDDPVGLLSSMPRWLVTLLICALVASVAGPLILNSVFSEKWYDPKLPAALAAVLFLIAGPLLGMALHGSAWWAYAPRRSDVVEMDRLHQGQVVELWWQDYTAADTTQQWWVAYLGDPDCTPVLEERGACTQEVCLQVQHGAQGYRWVTPAEVQPEQRCFRPGDLGRLTSSGDGAGVMSVRVYSGGGKAVFGPPEWLRRRLQQRQDTALAARTARVGGLGLAMVRARCISGMFDRSGGYPGACGTAYRPLANP